MAYFRIEYYSRALHRETSFEVLIPNDYREGMPVPPEDRPMRTLFLLHGYTGKAGNYVPFELPMKYHFAIVMPSADICAAIAAAPDTSPASTVTPLDIMFPAEISVASLATL